MAAEIQTAYKANYSRQMGSSIARFFVRVPAVVLLTITGLLMAVLFHFAFAARYTLAQYGQQAQQTAATLNHLSPEGAFLYIAGFLLLFGLYWIGFRRSLRTATPQQWVIVGLFAILFNVILLPMYPIDAADIYDYIIRGRMSAVYGLNPMHDVPDQVNSDPFFHLAAWQNVSSAYGPAWEVLASTTSRIVGDDYMANVIGFKLLSLLGYIASAILIALTLRVIAPRRMLPGVYLFAWNPFVIYLTGGGGHNDTIMTALILLSVFCLVKRWYVGSTLAAILGALVKFIPAMMLPIIAVLAFRELQGQKRIRYFVLSAILGSLMVVAFYAPYWTGFDTLALDRRAGMYTGSVATLARQTLGFVFDGQTGESFQTPRTNNVIKYVELILFAVFYIEQLASLLETPKEADPLKPIRVITALVLFYLLVTSIWFQSWYVVWVVGLVALLDNTPMRRFVLYFSYFVTWQSFLYNYVTLRYNGWAPLPWRDLIPVAVVMGFAWGYIAWFWISTWLRSANRTPLLESIGQKLIQARQALGLPVSELADQLDLRTDDLISYERGERPLPLDQAQALCQRLNLSLPELVTTSSAK